MVVFIIMGLLVNELLIDIRFEDVTAELEEEAYEEMRNNK